MKKLLCILTALLVLGSVCASAEGSGLTITPTGDVSAEEISAAGAKAEALQLTDRVTEASGRHTMLITWTMDGSEYEFCLGGLDEALTEDQARTMIGCFALGIPCELTGDALVDAEKASNKLPTALGKPIAEDDEVRKEDGWGDSSQCWAGSLSDMLIVTGWGQKAVNPDTSKPFADEDEVFSYFTANFSNGGNYQSDGAKWFFDGTYERDVGMADLRREGSGGLLPGTEVPVTKYKSDDPEESDRYYDDISSTLLALRDGGCIGLDVVMWQKAYILKESDLDTATYDSTRGTYGWDELFFVEDASQLQDETFILQDGTGTPVLVSDQGNGLYADAEGNTYPAERVLTGKFALHTDGQLYAASCEANSEEYTYSVSHTVAESDLDMDKPEYVYAGSHALTAIGYVRCTEGDTGYKALMIIDSDNDAHCYSPVSEAVLKQDRPNTYTLYFVQDDVRDDILSIALSDYIGLIGYLSGLTLMTAAE